MGGDSSLDLTAGFYKSRQTIDMDWLWSSYLLEAKGDNAALIDVKNAAGVLQTDGGLVAYGASFFGGCCRRTYNLDFDTNAPYASLSYNAGKLTFDGSLRYDAGNARGYVAGDGPVVATDVDGNGVISVPESKTTIMPLSAQRPVNYNYNYWSYSAGANYRVANNLSVFARYSKGGRANADRFVFGGNTSATSGALLPNARPVDFVRQAEAGVKYQSGRSQPLWDRLLGQDRRAELRGDHPARQRQTPTGPMVWKWKATTGWAASRSRPAARLPRPRSSSRLMPRSSGTSRAARLISSTA